jgi:hypothetical protein
VLLVPDSCNHATIDSYEVSDDSSNSSSRRCECTAAVIYGIAIGSGDVGRLINETAAVIFIAFEGSAVKPLQDLWLRGRVKFDMKAISISHH